MSFLAPADGPEGLVDITPGAMSDRERNAILSRAALPETQARLDKTMERHIDGDTHSHLYQFTVRSQPDGSFVRLLYGLDRLLGEAEPYVGYRPETFLSRSIHNGFSAKRTCTALEAAGREIVGASGRSSVEGNRLTRKNLLQLSHS